MRISAKLVGEQAHRLSLALSLSHPPSISTSRSTRSNQTKSTRILPSSLLHSCEDRMARTSRSLSLKTMHSVLYSPLVGIQPAAHSAAVSEDL